ncbi:MAG: hypothetical protein QOJ42_4943 [Acidobacteriaceae bacterium]|nr:hypothetical protein [Acidobacteriaceae bacterium]
MPMVPACRMMMRIHPLLHDSPLSRLGDDEGMQVQLKAIGDRIVIHACGEPACLCQSIAVQPGLQRESAKLVRGSEQSVGHARRKQRIQTLRSEN